VESWVNLVRACPTITGGAGTGLGEALALPCWGARSWGLFLARLPMVALGRTDFVRLDA
jgi:hypothetical protein